MAYLCEQCKENNNGWCKANKFNGLKKKNIQKCAKFDPIIVSEDGEEVKTYCIIYDVHNVPGRDCGFQEFFEYETSSTDMGKVEEEALEYLGEYFYAGNFTILSIGLA